MALTPEQIVEKWFVGDANRNVELVKDIREAIEAERNILADRITQEISRWTLTAKQLKAIGDCFRGREDHEVSTYSNDDGRVHDGEWAKATKKFCRHKSWPSRWESHQAMMWNGSKWEWQDGTKWDSAANENDDGWYIVDPQPGEKTSFIGVANVDQFKPLRYTLEVDCHSDEAARVVGAKMMDVASETVGLSRDGRIMVEPI